MKIDTYLSRGTSLCSIKYLLNLLWFLLSFIKRTLFVAGPKKLLLLLILKGAKVDAKANSGTPLQWAASHGQKKAVEILLDKHADVSVPCCYVLHLLNLFVFLLCSVPLLLSGLNSIVAYGSRTWILISFIPP